MRVPFSGFDFKYFSDLPCSSTLLTSLSDYGIVGGSRGRPRDHPKFMKTFVSGTHEVIGSIIKEHVKTHQMTL